MKKIGIDARLINQTGVGVYIQNLLRHLEKLTPQTFQINVYLLKRDRNRINFKSKNFVKKEADFYWHELGEQTAYLNFLNNEDLDLMHFTYFSYPILYKRRFVATIHDLTPLLFKTGRASTKNRLFYAVKHAMLKVVLGSQVRNSSAIITPSLAVKTQIIESYGQKYQSKIYPIHEGVNEKLKKTKENTALGKRFNKFVICINTFYPHKNTERLIKAYADIKTDHKLILIGPSDIFSGRMSQLIKKLNQEKRILIYTDSTLSDLVFFYKNAEALINPSISEGFGLSLLEASYFGCPVIASNIDVFGEIMGDSYVSFNPYKIDDIRTKIEYFLNKKPVFNYKNIIAKYSFDEMTARTLEIYKKLLS